MDSNFHKNLAICVSSNNVEAANRLIMEELGHMVVHHRTDFVDLLVNSDAPAYAEMADAELIKLYFENIHKKELLIGTALLVNMHNKTGGFDGDGEVSDLGVKASYKVLSSYLAGPLTNQEIETERQNWRQDGISKPVALPEWYRGEGIEKQSNFWGAAIGGATNLANNIVKNQHNKKYGALDAARAQQQAKADIAKSIIAERTAQIKAAEAERARKAKNIRLSLIVGGSVLGVALIGTIIYLMKKK